MSDNDNERTAEALEEIADQLRIQNGVLLEVAVALERRNRLAVGGEFGDVRRRGTAKSVEDNVLNLSEGVDLSAVDRVADR